MKFVLLAMGLTAMNVVGARELEKTSIQNQFKISEQEFKELNALVSEEKAELTGEINVKIFNSKGDLVDEYSYLYGSIQNDPRHGVKGQDIDLLMETDNTVYYLIQN